MDHLPTFNDSTRPYPQVPYLGSGKLPSSPFHDLPQQQGWNLDSLQRGHVAQGQDGHATTSFIQDWLYFGLLCELSTAAREKAPKLQDFVKSQGSTKVVTGKQLDKFIQKRVVCISEMRSRKKSEGLQSLEAVLETTSNVVGHLWSASMGGNRQSPIPVEVILSIMVLGSSIDSCLVKLDLVASKRSWRLTEAARMFMAREGWCRRDMAMAESGLSEVSMYCASHLQRHNGHSGSGSTAVVRHDRCTDYACEAKNINEATYRTEHATANCRCEFWRVNSQELEEIIKQDRIPYIQLKRESGSSPQERRLVPSLGSFKNSTGMSPYQRLIIFSHVWSDGLGNPHENALPMCQLQRFYDMLEDSPWEDVFGRDVLDLHDRPRIFKKRRMRQSGTSFVPPSMRKWNRKTFNKSIKIWIDTLCVPLANETRKIAIRMLKRYYSFAVMTVVLDKSLYSLNHKSYSQGELLLRIGLSSWMSRCWTMQEAVIAGGAINVRFADGWYPLMDVVAFIRRKNGIISSNVMSDEQRSKVKKRQIMCLAFIVPAWIAAQVLQPGQLIFAVAQHLCFWCACGLCAMDKKNKEIDGTNKERLEASQRLFDDSKQFFAPVAALAKQTMQLNIIRDDAELVANTISRTINSWHGLRYRNTSHQSDRFLNFAFGCAKDDKDFETMRAVLELPVHEWLRSWYLAQVALPSGLLFLEGPKMSISGFHWAPSDIHPAFIEDDSPASCLSKKKFRESGPEGSLRIDKPALMLEQVTMGPADVWQVFDRASGLLHVVNLDWGSTENPGFRRNGFQGSLAIILSHPPQPGHSTVGAVVESVARLAKQNSGVFVCRAMVLTQPQGTSSGQAGVVSVSPAKLQRWIIS